MVEEKDESYLDTVKAAVEGQKTPAVEPGPQIAKQTETPKEEPKEEHVEGTSEGTVETEETKAEGDKPAKDKSEEPKEAVQDEVAKPDISRPPKRAGLGVKQQWLAIPEHAREAIWEREQTIDTALKRYDGLGQFAIKAEQNGTTLAQAMRSYNQMEQAIRADPVRGVAQTLQAIGYDPTQFFQ